MKSLGIRLALIISAVLFVLMVLAGVWLDRQLTNAIYDEELDQGGMHAQTMLASLRTLMVNGQGTLARDWLERMRREQGVKGIAILRRDGSEAFTDLATIRAVNSFLEQPRFSRSPSDSQGEPEDSPYFARALQGRIAVDRHAPDRITMFLPIRADAECQGCHGYEQADYRGVLKLSLSSAVAERRIASMHSNLWLIATVLTLLLAVVLWLAMRFSVVKPIARLRHALGLVASGDRSMRLPVDRDDEIGTVSAMFNRMQEQLDTTETRVHALADNVMDAIITVDDRGVIEMANPAVHKVFGYRPEELVGRDVMVLMPEPYRSNPEHYLATFFGAGRNREKSRRREFVALHKNGSTFPVEIAVSTMKISGRRHFISVVHDITERKQQLKTLEHQALHDALTGLPNRSLLSDRLQQGIRFAVRDRHRLVLMIIDLDHFKVVNDTLGHHYGDVLLQQVAEAMRSAVRSSDTVARLGGDEFAVLLPNADIQHARRVANKLLTVLSKPISYDGHDFILGASIGVALFPAHGEDMSTLMRHADVAMYAAKKARGGYAVYDADQDHHSVYSLSLMSAMRTAIDNNELMLCYQPVVDMKSGCVTGVEALARWNHPQYGILYPDEFIPLSEQTGQIRALTNWVLGEAMMQCQRWERDGLELRVAVNLSVHCLHEDDFPDMVAGLLAQRGMASPQLRLEVTESAIMSRSSQSMAILMRLRELGVRMSIDDFGTGYSSLSYLKELPVDEIKIDKGFVLGMAEDENNAAIVHAIIELSHNMGLSVVAEGVEDLRDYQALERFGCDAIQGYYVSEPLTADELVDWLQGSDWQGGVKQSG